MGKIVTLGLLISSIVLSSATIPANFHNQNYEVVKREYHYAPVGGGELIDYSADVYFSQGYFEHPSYEYDPHLASASLAFAVSTFTYATETYDEEWYSTQSRYAKEFLEVLEFNTFETNDDYKQTARFDSIGLCAAKKEFGDYTVVAIAPRSGGYFSEWASNVNLGNGSKSDMMHEGWYNAANKLINFLTDYVNQNVETTKVKLWMAGFSRGGATTNLAAGLIDNKIDQGERLFNNANISREDVYAYTFEAPQGANVNSKTVKKPKDSLYNNIFNIVNPLDIVPKLAMKEYGFTRFGIDKYITNKFYDPENYENNRKTFNVFLKKYHQNSETELAPDAFKISGFEIGNAGADIILTLINFIATDNDLPTILVPFEDKRKQNYDASIAFDQLMRELVSQMGNRDNFYKKFEPSLIKLMLAIQDEKNGNPNFLLALLKIVSVGAIIKEITSSTKLVKSAISLIWGDSLATTLYNAFDVLVGPLGSTYWEKPNELLSIAAYVNNIFQNHYPEVTISHVASQDSYYLDDYEGEGVLKEVPFLNNVDYGRMHFFGYNDIGLRLNSKSGTRVINIEGHVLGKSDVKDCQPSYAAGYYSYATEEKMDIFMPVNQKYNISMKSYSKKPYHRCEYWAYYEYFTLDNTGKVRKQVDHKKEKVCFNSDRHKRDVTIKV